MTNQYIAENSKLKASNAQLTSEVLDNEKVIRHLIATGQKTEDEYATASSISNAHLG